MDQDDWVAAQVASGQQEFMARFVLGIFQAAETDFSPVSQVSEQHLCGVLKSNQTPQKLHALLRHMSGLKASQQPSRLETVLELIDGICTFFSPTEEHG